MSPVKPIEFFFNIKGFRYQIFGTFLVKASTDDHTADFFDWDCILQLQIFSSKLTTESAYGKTAKNQNLRHKNPLHQGKCVSKSSCKKLLRKS